MKLVTILAVIVALLGVTGCETEKSGRSPPSIIPTDVSYTVIGTETVPHIKRSLDVRLNKKVSEDVLRAIALELKSNDSNRYARTFIVYYLPGMTVDAGGWATSHFNPKLEVRIQAFSAQRKQAPVTEPSSSGRKIIGSWLGQTVYDGSRYTLYREEGARYMELKFKDGSILKHALVEKPSPLGYRFDIKEGSSTGDHWIIDLEGNLQIRDMAGLISTAKRIQ